MNREYTNGMSIPRIVEYGFLFVLLAAVGYVAWKVFAPFMGVLALSVVVTVLAYPLFERLHYAAPWRKYPGISAFLTVSIVYTSIIGAVSILAAVVLREARAIYTALSSDGTATLGSYIENIEHLVRVLIPDFTINRRYRRIKRKWRLCINRNNDRTSISLDAYFILSLT